MALADRLHPLIEEAWERTRRRRRRGAAAAALVAMAAAGAGVLVGLGGAAPTPPSSPPPAAAVAPASAAQVNAFVADAASALNRRFSATYAVTYNGRRARPTRSAVVVAQLGRDQNVYRSSPRHEVFSKVGHGLFTCKRAGAAAPWSCIGPHVGIGMGATWQLTGPYPPSNLLLSLQNAVADAHGAIGHRHRKLFIVHRKLNGEPVRCLDFGGVAHPHGSVCIDRIGLIAYSSVRTVSSDYRTATLRSYSTRVPRALLALPATPGPSPA